MSGDSWFSNLKVGRLVSNGVLTCRELQAETADIGTLETQEKIIEHLTAEKIIAETEIVDTLVANDLTVAGDLTTQDATIKSSLQLSLNGSSVDDVWTCTDTDGNGEWTTFTPAPQALQLQIVNSTTTIDMSTIPSNTIFQLLIPNTGNVTLDFPVGGIKDGYWKAIGGIGSGTTGSATLTIQTNGQTLQANYYDGTDSKTNTLSSHVFTTRPGTNTGVGSSINLDIVGSEATSTVFVTGFAFGSVT